MSAKSIIDTTRVPVAVIQWFAGLFFLLMTRPVLADLCTSPNILMSDGSCYLVTVETTLDIAPLVDVDPNPFPYIYDTYVDLNVSDVFVQGALPTSARLAVNWTYASRPAFTQLRQQAEVTLAQQLGVPVDNILRRSAYGQINALMYIEITQIINTPAADREAFEQQVYDEIQLALTDRRRHIATLAAEQYNIWRDYPCGYQVPVGDDPSAYLSQYAVSSYCLAAESGNPLVIAFTNTPAIPSGSYLYWATQMRMESFMTYWDYLTPDSTLAAFSNAFLDTKEAMAYNLAWGTLSALPSFDYNSVYSTDATVVSGVQRLLAEFSGNYFRDFVPSLFLEAIFSSPDGLIPDPRDLAILASALAVHATLEIVDQVQSREGVNEAMAQSTQSLESVSGSEAGRAELLMMLIELGMPDLVKWGVVLPAHDMPVSSVFYSTQTPQSDLVTLKDWGPNYSSSESLYSQFIFSDQHWLGRSYGGVIDIRNPRYDGFTPYVRFVAPNGDFDTAWLVKGQNGAYRQFLITRYAKLLRQNVHGTSSALDPEVRVSIRQLINADCPAKGSYPYNSNPVDHGMSCVIVENNGASYFPSAPDPEKPLYQKSLAIGDTVIIAGRVATIKRIEIDDISGRLLWFTTEEPVIESGFLPDNQEIRKIYLNGGSGVPTDRFEYKIGDGTATAILDFSALPPEIAIAHPELVVEANAVMSTVNLGEVTAIDPTDGAVAVTSDAPVAFPLGSTAVTYTATDSAGNSTTATQTVTVVDTTVPQFSTLPQQLIVEATANPMPVILDVPLATDIFPVTVASNAQVDGYTLGDTVVTWTATDTSGNSVSVQQIVTITDTTPPVFTTVPADFTMEATGPLTLVNPGLATATDLFGATVSHDVPAAGMGIGAHVITWTAVDTNGNQTQVTQTVTVVDTTPPSITLEFPSIQVEASDVLSLVNLGTATALDLVDGSVAVTHDAPVAFPLGSTLVTYSAVDSRGNLATVTQSVTVVDTTPPEFTTLPLDIDRIAEGPNSSFDLGVVEASDIFAVTITNDAPATLPVGTTIVTWTATDTSGNAATVTQTIQLSYQFGGFEKPLEANGVYKVNRVLPLRIGLTYADGSIAETAEVLISVGMLESGEDSSEPVIIDVTDTADSGNRFLLRGGMFQYNLETRSLASGTYRLMVTLDDGNHYTIDIALKQ